MSTIVAKTKNKAEPPEEPSDGDKRRGRGRPETGITTVAFSCRVPITMIEAFNHLARTVGSGKRGTELYRPAENHLIARYFAIRDDKESKHLNAQHVENFLAAAEAYFREVGMWPPKRPSS